MSAVAALPCNCGDVGFWPAASYGPPRRAYAAFVSVLAGFTSERPTSVGVGSTLSGGGGGFVGAWIGWSVEKEVFSRFFDMSCPTCALPGYAAAFCGPGWRPAWTRARCHGRRG